ncbi:MAG: 4Fe-4S dicluster domain-containing protein, partial [Bacteroidota bacterium]|nr:4Fe-4S dicluster domain-containing protein [Bacteroidota bacterium]
MKLYFDPFVIPFSIGFLILLGVLFYKYIRWYRYLPKSDKKLIRQGLFTRKSLLAMREIFYESLLHRKIFKVNPRLGYMHMSLAFGWFLLIVVGKVETLFYLDDPLNPPYVPVFFRFYFPDEPLARATYINFAFFMDLLLLFVLTGLAMAFMKRMKPSTLGMKKTTKHTLGDRVALSALWFIFPLRLLAESLTCGIYQSGSFLTGTLGKFLATFLPVNDLAYPAWWAYSLALGSFFIAMPFSRYMHILTEIPLIFLRQYGLKANESYTSYSDFQVQACSRCGICIDPCQLNTAAGITDVQSVYVLRDHREKKTCRSKVENCLLCGRCENVCPVGIELNTLRISLRNNNISESSDRFSYLPVNHNPIANA